MANVHVTNRPQLAGQWLAGAERWYQLCPIFVGYGIHFKTGEPINDKPRILGEPINDKPRILVLIYLCCYLLMLK